jgi:hypothetical protein
MRKCGYCGKEIDESELIKETVNCWAPDVGHECDYIEEKCPHCGWYSDRIEDQLESWVY